MTLIDTLALTLLVVVVATMPVFAVVSRNRPRDPDVARRSSTALLGFWVRDWLMWVIGPIERVMVRAKVSPDVFNYLGVAFGIGAGAAFAQGALSLAGWAILFGGVADVFDGRIARARGMASRYGAFMDSTLDRFAEAFSFVGVTWYLSTTPWGAAISVLAISGSLLVSYTRARGEAVGVSGTGGVMQRAERLVLLALGALADSAVATRWGWPDGTVLTAAVTLIAVGSIGTAIYRTVSIASTLAQQDDL
ncbi:MAG: CDP-alcohol phosphatidyltransferase family protein [Acidobacteria bacterium]|nr:CDP-alcohol phosphatidyltransferase family protein [Acidobacteriota bacterium]